MSAGIYQPLSVLSVPSVVDSLHEPMRLDAAKFGSGARRAGSLRIGCTVWQAASRRGCHGVPHRAWPIGGTTLESIAGYRKNPSEPNAAGR